MAPSRPSRPLRGYVALTKPRHPAARAVHGAARDRDGGGRLARAVVRRRDAARDRARRGRGEHAQLLHRARPRRADGAHAHAPAAGARDLAARRRSRSASRSRVVSTLLLQAVAGPLAAALGVASILFYVFVYTVWLKPRSPWNAVIGGAAGAAAPLIADAAVERPRRRRGLAPVRDRLLLAAAPRLGDRAVPQGRLRARGHPDAAERDRRRADAPAHAALRARARAVHARARRARPARPALSRVRDRARRLVPLARRARAARAQRRRGAARVRVSLAYLFALFLAMLVDLALPGPTRSLS